MNALPVLYGKEADVITLIVLLGFVEQQRYSSS